MNNGQYSPRGFNVLPPAVKNLIIINTICFVASITFMRVNGTNLNDLLGLHFFKGEGFAFYQYITYMFMHGSWSHLIFNMLALWMFGYLLENTWGTKRFLLFYFVTGVGAAFVQTIVNAVDYYSLQSAINLYAQNPSPDAFIQLLSDKFEGYYNPMKLQEFITAWRYDLNNGQLAMKSISDVQDVLQMKADIPTVGASGAVYGVLLAFGMMFPNMLIFIYFLFPIRAKWFVLLYGALELFSGVFGSPDGVAHFAHLGGMIFGYFLIRHWRKKGHSDTYQY